MQLDLFQQPKPSINPNKLLTQQRIKEIEGLQLLEDFIDTDYEIQLINMIDGVPWSNELKRRVQHFGYRYNYKTRQIGSGAYLGPLPDWLQILANRLFVVGLITYKPDQAIINEYLPGQGIAPHVDCEPCFGDSIISVSLGSGCCMLFEHVDNHNRVELMLERRTALLMEGDARYFWRHSIPARKVDPWPDPVSRQRRLSVTFRKVCIE